MTINVVRGQIGVKNQVFSPKQLATDANVRKEAAQDTNINRNPANSDAVVNSIKKSPSEKETNSVKHPKRAQQLAGDVKDKLYNDSGGAKEAHSLTGKIRLKA